tara:strand:+ start:1639 stop:2826 length:1188 start_codon:yes stop_codon:yes gene_type:complete
MSLNDKKTVFFATRPISPPWNEGSKNLVYQLAKEMNTFSPLLLTYKDQNDLIGKENICFQKIYPRVYVPFINSKLEMDVNCKKSYYSKYYLAFTPKQKLYFLYAFLKAKASIYHFYFSPEILTSNIIRIIKKFKRGKFLQTFATPVKNEKLIQRLVFGDAVVVQSDYSLNLFKKSGIKNVHRIYPGIDTDHFKPGAVSSSIRNDYKITEDKYVILYCGNYFLGCNDDLVKTIKNLTKKNKQFVFIVACRLSYLEDKVAEDHMKKIFKEEQITNQVIFIEDIVDIRQLIEISDIQIFPPILNRKADIPIVLIESLAMEKPIVITDIDPFNEIMKNDVGEIVPPGNVDLLSKAILKLFENREIRIAKGKRGREMVIREFNLKNYVTEYNIVYESLLC